MPGKKASPSQKKKREKWRRQHPGITRKEFAKKRKEKRLQKKLEKRKKKKKRLSQDVKDLIIARLKQIPKNRKISIG